MAETKYTLIVEVSKKKQKFISTDIIPRIGETLVLTNSKKVKVTDVEYNVLEAFMLGGDDYLDKTEITLKCKEIE
jgi:hypothetical protein